MRVITKCMRFTILTLFGALFYCEYCHYYVVLLACDWPFSIMTSSQTTIKSMILADPHILGKRRGHWFDKLRREWQMWRTYSTAINLFRPESVIILGDIFDEGDIAGEYFPTYATRFDELFGWAPVDFIIVAGNHDIGFHYAMSSRTLSRFEDKFDGSTGVKLRVIKGIVFILINSMALHDDGCRLCANAHNAILNISKSITCWNHRQEGWCGWNFGSNPPTLPVSPVILMHFPMYRNSDEQCSEPDEAPPSQKSIVFRNKVDCLSEEASNKLINLLQPRVVFNGHSHNGCTKNWGNFTEHTLSSFSWRNRNNPAFLLAQISPSNVVINKCLMPQESTVFFMYYCAGALIILYAMSLIRVKTLGKSGVKSC